MKKTLSELSMAEYIDLVCGDYSVLKAKMSSKEKRERIRRDIMLEYQEICDKTMVKKYLKRGTAIAKARAGAAFFGICKTLMDCDREEDVRQLMEDAGINTRRMDTARLNAEIDSRLARANNELKSFSEEEDKDIDEKAVRSFYDSQTAAMMSHFKFQIDPGTMKATLYAHLVEQCVRECKAIAEVNKKKR